ncbi:MAG: hypothetical protein COC06_05250 [Bacteroidales bacterium]|nr:MAG: hypothetical protein COC06_05250 [Bacteroidales bacterium]
MIVITIAIFLSESRAGILAILTATAVFFLLRPDILSKFRTIKYAKLLMGLTFVFILTGAFILYHKKKDSANGRILIWQVSWEMIKDKPVLGHGYGAFQAEYMNYQAEYFKNKPDSEFELLADNVKHPFNEFVKLAVEFGITGLVVVLLVILFVLWKLMKSKDQNSPLVLSGLLSFLVFACFSYPLQYIAVWLLLAFYLSVLLPSKKIRFENTPFVLIAKSLIIIACVFSLYNIINHIKLEIRWKTIALNSLKGNTEKMLPEYEKLYSASLNRNPFFLYNYGAELNVANRFDKSIDVLTECQQQFNDYDLQMLLADNYDKKGEADKAIQTYQHASNMVPCRFLPLYKLFNIYRLAGAETKAKEIALEIVSKKIKVPSYTVSSIRAEAEEYISGTAR